MRDFISILIMPLTIFWLLIISAAVLFLVKRKKSSVFLIFTSLLWLLIITTRFISDRLVNRLENQYTPLVLTDSITGRYPVYIMILGAGYYADDRFTAIDRISANSLCRLAEGIRLQRLITGSKIVLSGDNTSEHGNQAELMTRAAVSLGVQSSFIEKIGGARNTGDEASRFYSTFGNTGSLILVTDAVHMPRAMKLFRKAGLNPVASPTNHLIKKEPADNGFKRIPLADNIVNMEYAIHEYAGLLWTDLGGR